MKISATSRAAATASARSGERGNQARHTKAIKDSGAVTRERRKRRLPKREHAAIAEGQVEPNQRHCCEERDSGQGWCPTGNAEIRRNDAENGRGGEKKALARHARLTPPNRIARLCHSATRMRIPNITGSRTRRRNRADTRFEQAEHKSCEDRKQRRHARDRGRDKAAQRHRQTRLVVNGDHGHQQQRGQARERATKAECKHPCAFDVHAQELGDRRVLGGRLQLLAQEGEPQQRSDRQGRNKAEHDQHHSWSGKAPPARRNGGPPSCLGKDTGSGPIKAIITPRIRNATARVARTRAGIGQCVRGRKTKR